MVTKLQSKILYAQIFTINDKATFSASLLQSSVSHDPSEIILKALFAAA